MTIETFSIAKTRDSFATLVHDLKYRPVIQVTRRGHPVAVLLSGASTQALGHLVAVLLEGVVRWLKWS